MVNEGTIANALVTALAAGAFLFVAREVRRRRLPVDRRALASVLLFGIIAAHLALAALRQVVAYIGAQGGPDLVALEAGIFYVTVLPAAFVVVPLGYMAGYALTGKEESARAAAAFFVLVITFGYGLVVLDGITGPARGYWGSEFVINSLVARGMILAFLTIPAFVAATILIRAGRGEGASARRARIIGIACLVYYTAFTLDALGVEAAWLLPERIAMAGAAFLGYRAYFGAGAPEAGREAALAPDAR